MKAERGEAVTQEKVEANRGWFVEFKGRSHHHNMNVQSKAVSADLEAIVYYPENPIEITD